MRPTHIAPPTGGASLMVAWRLKGKRVLVVGGGREAAGRVFAALEADAVVTVVAPRLNAVLAHRVRRGEIDWRERAFLESDLDGADMVLSAVDDSAVSELVSRAARVHRIPVNCADRPEECDFWFPAVHRDGPVQIAVSTNGHGPGLAARIRDQIAAGLPMGIGAAVARYGEVRAALRASVEEPRRRMAALSALAGLWPIEPDWSAVTPAPRCEPGLPGAGASGRSTQDTGSERRRGRRVCPSTAEPVDALRAKPIRPLGKERGAEGGKPY